jgi:hypothetical protein
MTKGRCIRILATLALAVIPTVALAADATVEIRNKSDWDFHNFYLSPTEEAEWGPDQLGDLVLESGASFELTGIPCDSYDVKLVDEDGDECVVPGVDICRGDQGWVIDNDDLLECEGYE